MRNPITHLCHGLLLGILCLSHSILAADAGLRGQPFWFPLGEEVYHEGDVDEAEKEVLSFRAEPRWFLAASKLVSKKEYEACVRGVEEKKRGQRVKSEVSSSLLESHGGKFEIPDALPFPKRLEEIPKEDQGVTLKIGVANTRDPKILMLKLTLGASKRAVIREVEHRWNNVVPFLFSIFADGYAVKRELTSFGKEGALNYPITLVERGGQRTWELKVEAASIDALVANSEVRKIQLTACFSERQHVGYFDGDDNPILHMETLTLEHPQILTRSNTVSLVRSNGRWRVEDSVAKKLRGKGASK